MALKQFLKPDWRKIVIFVILFLFLSFIYLSFFTNTFLYVQPDPRGSCCDLYSRSLCENFISMHHIGFENKIPEEICLEYKKSIQEEDTLLITNLFSILIVSYIVSCLIVWIYGKFRKKKVKKV